MKPKKNTILQLAAASIVMLTNASQAQFTSGSDGSDGELNVTANMTVPLPEDGILNYTTITVAPFATLRFTPNAKNTPVYLLATGDITINGAIDISGAFGSGNSGGKGGPGGFDGGNKARPDISAAGDGFGPGGAVPGVNATFIGSPLLIPLVGGGGGRAGSVNGNGGGGAILLASTTKVSLQSGGSITASSPGSGATGGAGGAVRIVAPDVEGSGVISVTAQFQSSGPNVGKVRVDSFALTNQTWNIQGNKSFGANMIIFPENLPKLEIIEVAGTAVDPNAAGPVTVDVGEGEPEAQTVKVRATNFGKTAEVTVVVVPEAGPSAKFDLDIPHTGDGTASVTVNVPANTVSHLYIWTR